MERFGYIELIGKAFEEVLGKDCLIIFFGSVVKGNFRSSSDIDVGVYCGKELDPRTYVKLLERVENLPILRDVQIVDLAKISEEFLKSIITEGLVWSGSEKLLEDLKKRIGSLQK